MCDVKTCKLPEFFRWFKSFLVCGNLFVYTGIRRIFFKWKGTLFIYFISIDKAPSISQMLVLFWDSWTIPTSWIFKLLNKHPKIFLYLIKHSTIVTRFWHSFWIYTCDHNFHLLSSRLCFFPGLCKYHISSLLYCIPGRAVFNFLINSAISLMISSFIVSSPSKVIQLSLCLNAERRTAIFVEFIIKPKNSISREGKSFDISGCIKKC